MLVLIAAEEGSSGLKTILPESNELIYGTLAFVIVFAVLAKFAFPAMNRMLAARTAKIQGDLERAEQTRRDAEGELADYRRQLAGARDEAGRIIEEARKTADQLRKDLQAKAEQASEATVAHAQEEIRAERDRVFQELKTQVGEIAVELAGRVVGRSLDKKAHDRMIDDYIEQVAGKGEGNGSGA